MISSILLGLLASFCVSAALAMSALSVSGQIRPWWTSLWVVLLVAAVAVVQKWVARAEGKRGLADYDGVPDLLMGLHAPALQDRPARWTLRGIFSWALSGLGLAVGPEGAAAELGQAVGLQARGSASRWFDLRSRAAAARALAAAMSAGFGAPFAAILLPSELAIGGGVIPAVLASLSAYVGIRYLTQYFGQYGMTILGFQDRISQAAGFHILDWREWFSSSIVCLASFAGAMIVLISLRWLRQSIGRLSRGSSYLRTLWCGGILLSIILLSQGMLGPLPGFLEMIVHDELPLRVAGSVAAALFLTLAAIHAGLGSMGVWWPSLVLGALVSLASARWVVDSGYFHTPGLANLVLLGAACWCSAWFRTPVTFAVLLFEITSRESLLLPAVLACWLCSWAARRLGGQSLIEDVLESRNFPIRSGRSISIMKRLTAADAMVTGFQSVHQHASVDRCVELIRTSQYPVLAVTQDAGTFVGLVMAEQIAEGIRARDRLEREAREGGDPRLVGLLEAKDLVFRLVPEKAGDPTGLEARSVRLQTPLDEVAELLEMQPCIAVLSDAGAPVGLIFPHDIRHAYDREVARASFMVQAGFR